MLKIKKGLTEMENQDIKAIAQRIIDEVVPVIKNIIKNITDVFKGLVKNITEHFERPIPEPRLNHPIVWDTRRNSQVMSRKPLLVRRMNM